MKMFTKYIGNIIILTLKNFLPEVFFNPSKTAFIVKDLVVNFPSQNLESRKECESA